MATHPARVIVDLGGNFGRQMSRVARTVRRLAAQHSRDRHWLDLPTPGERAPLRWPGDDA